MSDNFWSGVIGALVMIIVFAIISIAHQVGYVAGQQSAPMACEPNVDSVVVKRPVRVRKYVGPDPMTQAHVDSFPALTNGAQRRVP